MRPTICSDAKTRTGARGYGLDGRLLRRSRCPPRSRFRHALPNRRQNKSSHSGAIIPILIVDHRRHSYFSSNSGSLAMFAAMRRAASAGINTTVLSQKRLERLTVAFRYGSTQRYCLIFWLIRLNKIRCPVLKSLASCQYGAVPKPRMGELAALVPSAGIKHSQ